MGFGFAPGVDLPLGEIRLACILEMSELSPSELSSPTYPRRVGANGSAARAEQQPHRTPQPQQRHVWLDQHERLSQSARGTSTAVEAESPAHRTATQRYRDSVLAVESQGATIAHKGGGEQDNGGEYARARHEVAVQRHLRSSSTRCVAQHALSESMQPRSKTLSQASRVSVYNSITSALGAVYDEQRSEQRASANDDAASTISAASYLEWYALSAVPPRLCALHLCAHHYISPPLCAPTTLYAHHLCPITSSQARRGARVAPPRTRAPSQGQRRQAARRHTGVDSRRAGRALRHSHQEVQGSGERAHHRAGHIGRSARRVQCTRPTAR